MALPAEQVLELQRGDTFSKIFTFTVQESPLLLKDLTNCTIYFNILWGFGAIELSTTANTITKVNVTDSVGSKLAGAKVEIPPALTYVPLGEIASWNLKILENGILETIVQGQVNADGELDD